MCVRARVRVGAYVFVEYVRGSDARGTVANLEALLAGREVDGSDVKQLLARGDLMVQDLVDMHALGIVVDGVEVPESWRHLPTKPVGDAAAPEVSRERSRGHERSTPFDTSC